MVSHSTAQVVCAYSLYTPDSQTGRPNSEYDFQQVGFDNKNIQVELTIIVVRHNLGSLLQPRK